MKALHVVKCPLDRCDGTGFIEVDDGLSAAPCECRATRAKEAQLRRLGSGIPKRFRGVGWERRPICALEPSLLAELRRYCDSIDKQLEDGKGLWLAGPEGTGKTSIAMLAAKHAIAAGRSAAAWSLPKLLATIRSTYDDERVSYTELFELVTSVDLLVLDDVGTEKRTEWVLEQLFSIINERWAEERAIVMTTNLIGAELAAQIGARTVSRLAEICGAEMWIGGPDLRWGADA